MDKAEIRNPYDLIPYISNFKLQSRLHGEILSHNRQRKWYVDQFPEPTALLSTCTIDGTWSFFATGKQELQNFLNMVALPAEQVEIIVDEEWTSVIVSWLHKQLSIKEKYVSWQDMWEMDMSRVDKSEVSRLSEGVAPIHIDYADIIDRTTEDSNYYFVKYCIRYSPTACVYVNHKPVSWAMMNFDGSIGQVTTLPEYRKRGFNRMVLADLIAKSLEMGLKPYSRIEETDEESQRLLSSLNFCKMGKIAKIGVDPKNFVESESIYSQVS